mgnify:CR=1 FL=1
MAKITKFAAMKLYNQIDSKILKEQLKDDGVLRLTISFYKYVGIKNAAFFRDYLYYHFSSIDVRGRIYVAHEGINAQISIPKSNLSQFLEICNNINFLKNIRLNFAREDNGKSFFKLKVLVRDKIVADGIDDATFDASNTGKYLKAKEFNEIIEREDVTLIDMRNHYESEIGHFKNAWLPDVDTFRESLPKITASLKTRKDKPVVMYCTGGIRCEKASAYMKHNGFEEVYHLEGGIIEYARQIEAENLTNKFLGKNFVFDERLGETIGNEVIAQCHQCGSPCDTHTNCANEACHLLFIQCESCKSLLNNCCSTVCNEINALPIDEQRALRKGKKSRRNIFKKGRGTLPFMKKNQG